jgi:hypothetical protein
VELRRARYQCKRELEDEEGTHCLTLLGLTSASSASESRDRLVVGVDGVVSAVEVIRGTVVTGREASREDERRRETMGLATIRGVVAAVMEADEVETTAAMMVVEVVEVEGAGDEERLRDTTVLTTAEAAAEAAAMRVLKVADMMMAGGLKVVGVVESSPRWW